MAWCCWHVWECGRVSVHGTSAAGVAPDTIIKLPQEHVGFVSMFWNTFHCPHWCIQMIPGLTRYVFEFHLHSIPFIPHTPHTRFSPGPSCNTPRSTGTHSSNQEWLQAVCHSYLCSLFGTALNGLKCDPGGRNRHVQKTVCQKERVIVCGGILGTCILGNTRPIFSYIHQGGILKILEMTGGLKLSRIYQQTSKCATCGACKSNTCIHPFCPSWSLVSPPSPRKCQWAHPLCLRDPPPPPPKGLVLAWPCLSTRTI